jgi:hypothetical protein
MAQPPKEYDNSAGRLLKILRRAKQTEQNRTGLQTWLGILGTNDVERVHRSLLALKETLDDAEREIRETQPQNAELFLRHFGGFRSVIVPTNLDQPWGQFLQHLSNEALTTLEFCASVLPEETPVKPDELQQIREAVDALFTQVRESKLKKPLRDWLSELLSAVKRSIDLYEIRGPKAFRTALVTVTGELAAYGQPLQEVKEEEPELATGLGGLFNQIATFAERAEKLRPWLEYVGPVGDFVVKLLTGPG